MIASRLAYLMGVQISTSYAAAFFITRRPRLRNFPSNRNELFDAAGNLYVANEPVKGANTVTVYAPGAEAPEKVYRLEAVPTALAVP